MSRDRQQFKIISEKYFQENEIVNILFQYNLTIKKLIDRVRGLESLNAKLQDDNEILNQKLDIQNNKVRNLENQVKQQKQEIAILYKQISKESKQKVKEQVFKKQQQNLYSTTEKRITRSQVG